MAEAAGGDPNRPVTPLPHLNEGSPSNSGPSVVPTNGFLVDVLKPEGEVKEKPETKEKTVIACVSLSLGYFRSENWPQSPQCNIQLNLK